MYVDSRGLVAPANPYAGGTFDIVFDLTGHELRIATSDGRVENFALAPMSVADFYAAFMERLRRLGIDVHIWTMPSEIANAVPLTRTTATRNTTPNTLRAFTRLYLRPRG